MAIRDADGMMATYPGVRRCYSCVYFRETVVGAESPLFSFGECRAEPPSNNGWPRVTGVEWCGWYEARRGGGGG